MPSMVFNGYNTYPGNFRTRTLGQIYAEPKDEREGAEGKTGADYLEYHYENSGLPDRLIEDEMYNISTIYVLLLSRYANDPIKSADEERFKLELDSIIWMHAPEWQRNMQIADKVLALTEEQIKTGATTIINHALHPADEPSTDTPQILPYIDDQNATTVIGDDFQMVSQYRMMEKENATTRFLDKFKKLFITVAYPAETLAYCTEEEDNV